jgi:hypothetical protein
MDGNGEGIVDQVLRKGMDDLWEEHKHVQDLIDRATTFTESFNLRKDMLESRESMISAKSPEVMDETKETERKDSGPGAVNTSSSTARSSSTRAGSRKNRVFLFREFILATYGDYLESEGGGATILDVAGGKGDLSWLFANVDGIDAVVVDPRLTHQKHLLRSVAFLRDNPTEAKARAVPGLPTFQPLAGILPRLADVETFKTPRHLRLLVNQDLVDALSNYLETRSITDWTCFWTQATERAARATPLGYAEGESSSAGTISQAQAALETILQAKLIAGFHPDGATEACVDLALLLGIPVCIVPCCVFPADFPLRTNPDGSRLRTYAQLLDYLMVNVSSMQRAALDFWFTDTAKNQVLYTLSPITKDTASA